jgi:arsenate reductase
MAEGWGRELSNDKFEVKSAGIAPIGVHPIAIKTMREAGIDISGHDSSMLTPELLNWADYVITLCNSARDNCPVIPHGVRHYHWDIENPDRLYRSEEERNQKFAEIRDELKERIEELFDDLT